MPTQEPESGDSTGLTHRQQLVGQAVSNWKQQLIDLGGRNNLLYFRDLKAGTLTLSEALKPEALDHLFAGRRVRLSAFFATPDARKDAARRCRNLRAKAVENDEERGIQTLRVARGFATWTSDRSFATPNAPVLLYELEMRRTSIAADDFDLAIIGDPELNPTLIHLLTTDYGVHIDCDLPLDDPTASEASSYAQLVSRFGEQCRCVPGFQVVDRCVVGNFSYANLPMVSELEHSQEQIEKHDLLAALAGAPDALQLLRDRQSRMEADGIVAVPPPADEFLVLDADGSQSWAIAAAVAGSNLVVIGAPGTGKSQTISNLIATLIARGKSVLFVAEKRAAIEAVVDRLQKRGLGDPILDLHEGGSNRRRIAKELNRALAATGETLAPSVSTIHERLTRRRAQLEAYAEELHRPAEPWGLSPFNTQLRLLEIPDAARSTGSLLGSALDSLVPDVAATGWRNARSFVERGGDALLRSEGPWATTYAARRVLEPSDVTLIGNSLRSLLHKLPKLNELLASVTTASRLRLPETLDEAEGLLRLLGDVEVVREALSSRVFHLNLDELVQGLAFAHAAGPVRFLAAMFSGRFRRARKALRECSSRKDLSDAELLRVALLAVDVTGRWRSSASLGATIQLEPVGDLPALRDACEEVLQGLSELGEATGLTFPTAKPMAEIEEQLKELEKDSRLMRLPTLHKLMNSVRELGLDGIVYDAVSRHLPADLVGKAIEHVWLASILERLQVERPALAAFDPVAQEAAVGEFSLADRAHLTVAADRVRRAWAEGVVRARNEFAEEAALVEKQAILQKRHMSVRALFDRAEHVLLAVKPCWVMSPLVVAQVLPARPCFDVVVFDEASQIPPSDAVCSLLRGRQTIVAGDPHQLPPTRFFSSNIDDDTEDIEEHGGEEHDEQLAGGLAASRTRDIESILDAMGNLIPGGQRVLNWHYRSKDERLITFSNAQEALYDWSLITFPGALAGGCLDHVLVPFVAGAARVTASVPEEVQRVVELIIDHTQSKPEESLGVIALGIKHADRIREALRLVTSRDEELAALMDEKRDKPLFIKSLERVQGDERDAIILTVGYGRTVHGRMRYAFGPLNQEGGHRRLNVAITRARRRMTVVSSFSGAEMDPRRLNSVGATMLRDYLLYAESGGANLGVRAKRKPALNAFERDVQEQLTKRGLLLTPQYGASGYWIDFAVMHPERPSEPVMAIEADGASYHSAPSARDRDRLRQEHLERLGWRFHRIWSTDWRRSREREVDRAVEAYGRAIEEVDSGDAPSTNVPAQPEAQDWIPVASPSVDATARSARPSIRTGCPITEYTQGNLRALVRWVKSDGRLYTDEVLFREVMKFLGFRRRGPRITDAINRAIAAERTVLGDSDL